MVVTELTPMTLQWTLPCPSLCPEPLVQSPQTACLKFCLAKSIPFTSLLTGVGLLLAVWLLSFCFSCCWSTSLFPERCGSLASWVSCWLGCLCHFRSVRGLCSMGCYIQGGLCPSSVCAGSSAGSLPRQFVQDSETEPMTKMLSVLCLGLALSVS